MRVTYISILVSITETDKVVKESLSKLPKMMSGQSKNLGGKKRKRDATENPENPESEIPVSSSKKSHK